MAEEKGKAEEVQETKAILGNDPFDDLDMGWLDREEGAVSIEVLGRDPFEDMDVDWMALDADGTSPESAQAEIEVAFAETETRPVPAVNQEGALEQVVVEEFALGPGILEEFAVEELVAEPPVVELPVVEAPLPVQPMPPEAMPVPSPAGVARAEFSKPAATFHFPADFKWGVATAAHQVEGGNVHNDWWTWEQGEGHIKNSHTSRLACGWWERAEEDFDRAADMGLNALRLSVEWSRIEPQPGVFDDSALERYGQMLQGLRERNIEPMVTLHHFTNPHWLAEQGGWESPETIPLFVRFVRRVVETLGQYCDMWCTINEPNVYGILGYMEGIFPPGQSDLKAAMHVIRHMLTGHAAAYREIHTLQPHARVGLAHNMRVFDPVNPRSLLDRRVARVTDKAYNQAILSALTRGRWIQPLGFGLAWKLRRTLDWIGLNYYTRDRVAFDRTQNQALFNRRLHADGAELLDGDYGEFYPSGMLRCLKRLSRLDLPIYVTENGIPDADDDQRPRYLLTHVHQMWRAIQFCYPVMGYYHWTLADNFEWAEGWTLRFGLISLDPETQERTPRRSAELYAEIVQSNAITSQMIDTYTPRLRAELLPG
jgi:beta-glucosidase